MLLILAWRDQWRVQRRVAGGTLNLPTSTAMPRTIGCFVIGGITPFSVTIDETQSVDELKGAIKKKKEPELDAFAADRLTLYKVDIDGSDDDKCIEKVQVISQKLGDPNEAEKLHSLSRLSKYFRELSPTEGRIQILVQLPRGGAVAEILLRVIHSCWRVVDLSGATSSNWYSQLARYPFRLLLGSANERKLFDLPSRRSDSIVI
jgi:Crinkler effector protein N-terminal domain